MNRFEEKVAIVTGGGGYIGRAVGKQLAMEGCKVVLADIDESKLKEVTNTLIRESLEIVGIPTDVTQPKSVKELVNSTVSKWDETDILVNVAGGARNASVQEMSEEAWRDALDLNLTGSFFTIQAVIEQMKNQGKGKIVNTSSTAKDGVPWYAQANIGRTNYAAANAGLVGLTNTLAIELADYNINVNNVVPGPIIHPKDREDFQSLESDENVPASPLNLIPLGRYGTPEDVAKAVAFLASEDADFITGHSLYVSGGL